MLRRLLHRTSAAGAVAPCCSPAIIYQPRRSFISFPKSYADALRKTNPFQSTAFTTLKRKLRIISFFWDHMYFVALYQLVVQAATVVFLARKLYVGDFTVEQLDAVFDRARNSVQMKEAYATISSFRGGKGELGGQGGWLDMKSHVHTEPFVWPESLPRLPKPLQDRIDELLKAYATPKLVTSIAVANAFGMVSWPAQMIFAATTTPIVFALWKRLPLQNIPVLRRLAVKSSPVPVVAEMNTRKATVPIPRPKSFSSGPAAACGVSSSGAGNQKKTRPNDVRSSL